MVPFKGWRGCGGASTLAGLVPAAAIDVKEEAAAAILARLKGSYKVAPSQVFTEGGTMATDMVNSSQQLATETLNPAGMNTSAGFRKGKHLSPFDYRATWVSDPPIHSYTSVQINDDGMCFSGGRRYIEGSGESMGEFVDNPPGTWKLTLRRGGYGELYLDNLGSRIIEDTTAELKIKMYQGGEIVLVRN